MNQNLTEPKNLAQSAVVGGVLPGNVDYQTSANGHSNKSDIAAAFARMNADLKSGKVQHKGLSPEQKTTPAYQNPVRVQFETITPTQAYDILQNSNYANRNIRESRVNDLIRAIQTGNWKVNGDTIRFDCNGRLIDGQHRLWACALSGYSVNFLVVRNLNPDAYDTVDTNSPKTVADIIGPTDGEKNTNVLTAIVRMLIYDEYGILPSTGKVDLRPSAAEVREFISRNPTVRESAAYAATTGVKRIIRGSVAGYLHFKGTKNHPELWKKFSAQLQDGLGLTATDPVYHLRNRMIERRSDNTSAMNIRYALALAIKAWNAFVEGKPMHNLRFSKNEDFPTMI